MTQTTSDLPSRADLRLEPDEAPKRMEGHLKILGGSQSDRWNYTLLQQVLETLWVKHSDEQTRRRQVGAAVDAMVGIAPKDELEAMMGAQLLAAHNAAMECYRRAMIPEQSLEGRKENLTQANKLSRTATMMIEALNKHRGKGQQKVTVEHVHVHAGGQAVVGVVERPRGALTSQGGGVHMELEEQPHANQVEHTPCAPEPALRRQDAEREPLPVARDAQRALPHARG